MKKDVKFIKPEIDFLLKTCNFDDLEKDMFLNRTKGHTVEKAAEIMDIEYDKAYKISASVTKKVIRASKYLDENIYK